MIQIPKYQVTGQNYQKVLTFDSLEAGPLGAQLVVQSPGLMLQVNP